MRTLPVGKDLRILTARGLVAEPSESFRLELAEKGPILTMLERILTEGHAQIQKLLLDHKELSRAMMLELYERGVTKKVRNKAQQKLSDRERVSGIGAWYAALARLPLHTAALAKTQSQF